MKNKNQRGFFLLDLLISCLLIGILSAIAIPSIIGMIRAQNQQAAKRRVDTVSQAQTSIALCRSNPTCDWNTVQGILPLVPTPGTITTGRYNFTFAQVGNQTSPWTYTATPVSSAVGITAYFVDESGIERCNPLTADVTSPVCP